MSFGHIYLVPTILPCYFWVISTFFKQLTLLHSERPKLYAILAFLSAIGLSRNFINTKNMMLCETYCFKYSDV